jgi:glycosyltransferase involved in cell wall biosynthesis
MKKKIMAISQRPCFPHGMGGAEMSIALLLLRLKEMGNSVTIVGQIHPSQKARFIENISKLYPSCTVEDNKYGFMVNADDDLTFAVVLTRKFYLFSFMFIDTWKPDCIFTQLNGSLEIASFAHNRGIQTFHFFRDISNPTNFNILQARNLDLARINFISNSHFVKDHYKKMYGVNSKVSYPLPLQCSCNRNVETGSQRNLRLLYINPNECKGIGIVLKLAGHFRGKADFHVVEGWYKDDIIPLFNNPEITAHEKQMSLCGLYNYCDILLVPTQATFPEAYCRVAVEGLQHGMTVIASKHTGLIESVANGGILIENHGAVDEWVEAITMIIDDRSLLSEFQHKAREQFSLLYEQDQAEAVFNQTNKIEL